MVACARHEPEELALSMRQLVEIERRAIAAEIRHLDLISAAGPGKADEAESALRRDAILLFEEGEEAFARRVQDARPSWEGRLPPRTRKIPPPPRNPYAPLDLLSLESFSHPCLRKETPFRPSGFELVMDKNMAGHPLSPEPEEYREWIRAERPEDLPPGARGYIAEHLDKLEGIQAIRFRQSCGASLFHIARSAHRSRPHGPVFLGWLNRHARRHAGDPLEEVEGYGFLGGWRHNS